MRVFCPSCDAGQSRVRSFRLDAIESRYESTRGSGDDRFDWLEVAHMFTISNTNIPFTGASLRLVGCTWGPTYLPVVTRVTTGRIWQHFPDEETDRAHLGGRSNTGCTDSNTLPR